VADVEDSEIDDALTELWGGAKPAIWNRNRAAVGSWLAWCADKQHWTAPALPATAERQREKTDDTKAASRSRIDRLCRRRNAPLREKTLWRMLYESASRASAALALNIENLDLPNRQVKIISKGDDGMWIAWGTDTAHLLPRLIAGRESGPLFLSDQRPGLHRRATTDPDDIFPRPAVSRWATTAPASCSPTTPTACGSTNSGTPRPPTLARPTSSPTSSWPRPATSTCARYITTSNRPGRRPRDHRSCGVPEVGPTGPTCGNGHVTGRA
jgi:hypothetical protein